MELLVTAAVFLIVAGVVLAGYSVMTTESPMARRLRTVAAVARSDAPATAESGAAQPAAAPRRAVAAVGEFALSGPNLPLAQKLSSAGFRGRSAVAVFVGTRILVSFGPALLALMLQLSSGKPLGGAFFVAAMTWLFGHLLANYWLARRCRLRIQSLTESLPDALDLMVICLESGLGLNATIARVGEERQAMDDPLGREFAQVAMEVRSGRNREEALRGLGDRNGVEDLKSLAGLVIQSDRLGASLGKTLRAHSDLLRTKRRQRAEEAARKLPIKVLFPLATMLLPPIFVIVAGPAFIKFSDLVTRLTGQ
jgi:tight adherence protein C